MTFPLQRWQEDEMMTARRREGMKLSLRPHKCLAQQNCRAWWYDAKGHIDVLIHTAPNGPTVTCVISRRALEAYLKRSNPRQPVAGTTRSSKK